MFALELIRRRHVSCREREEGRDRLEEFSPSFNQVATTKQRHEGGSCTLLEPRSE